MPACTRGDTKVLFSLSSETTCANPASVLLLLHSRSSRLWCRLLRSSCLAVPPPVVGRHQRISTPTPSDTSFLSVHMPLCPSQSSCLVSSSCLLGHTVLVNRVPCQAEPTPEPSHRIASLASCLMDIPLIFLFFFLVAMCSEVCYLHRVRQKKPTALGYPSQTPARKHTQDNMIYKYKISHPRWKEPGGQCLWTGQKYVGTAVGMSKRREKEKENHQKIDDEKGKQKKYAPERSHPTQKKRQGKKGNSCWYNRQLTVDTSRLPFMCFGASFHPSILFLYRPLRSIILNPSLHPSDHKEKLVSSSTPASSLCRRYPSDSFLGVFFFVFFVASRTSSQDVRKREKNETDPNKEREG